MKIDLQRFIDLAHESEAEKPRLHMGASQIGNPCDRALWLSYRWAVIPKFEGRMLRLFRRGHAEEASIIADLEKIGARISGEQTRVNFGCGVSGSADAVISHGLPGVDGPLLAEFKTHSKKSFDALEKEGMRKAKPVHWAQMQAYMLGLTLERGLYYAVCKDDDRIYTELVEFDPGEACNIVERAKLIALSEEMPEGISQKPDWYVCKMCDCHSFCFSSKLTKEINCRTCAHSTPTSTGDWTCHRYGGDTIPPEHQYTGCPGHVLHPNLVPWPLDHANCTDLDAAYLIDGKTVINGEKSERVFTSAEILANPKACAHADAFILSARADLNAFIIDDGDLPF